MEKKSWNVKLLLFKVLNTYEIIFCIILDYIDYCKTRTVAFKT